MIKESKLLISYLEKNHLIKSCSNIFDVLELFDRFILKLSLGIELGWFLPSITLKGKKSPKAL